VLKFAGGIIVNAKLIKLLQKLELLINTSHGRFKEHKGLLKQFINGQKII